MTHLEELRAELSQVLARLRRATRKTKSYKAKCRRLALRSDAIMAEIRRLTTATSAAEESVEKGMRK